MIQGLGESILFIWLKRVDLVFMFIIISITACTNLMSDSDIPPCAMIKVFTVEPPETEWKKHSQTEISEVTTKHVLV